MASRCMDRSSSTAAILPRRVPANTARPDGSAHRAVTGEPSATVCVVLPVAMDTTDTSPRGYEWPPPAPAGGSAPAPADVAGPACRPGPAPMPRRPSAVATPSDPPVDVPDPPPNIDRKDPRKPCLLPPGPPGPASSSSPSSSPTLPSPRPPTGPYAPSSDSPGLDDRASTNMPGKPARNRACVTGLAYGITRATLTRSSVPAPRDPAEPPPPPVHCTLHSTTVWSVLHVSRNVPSVLQHSPDTALACALALGSPASSGERAVGLPS